MEEEFKDLVIKNWQRLDPYLGDFANNIKQIKIAMKEWDFAYVAKYQKSLKEVEEGIKSFFENNNNGIILNEDAQTIKYIEANRKDLLVK